MTAELLCMCRQDKKADPSAYKVEKVVKGYQTPIPPSEQVRARALDCIWLERVEGNGFETASVIMCDMALKPFCAVFTGAGFDVTLAVPKLAALVHQ